MRSFLFTTMLLSAMTLIGCTEKTPGVPVENITLDEDVWEMNAGDTFTLEATIAPAEATDQRIEWTSDDEKVVTVEDGVVTAVAEGLATVTATTKNGRKTASCDFIVYPEGKVTAVLLNATAHRMFRDDTFQLVATVMPDNADNKNISWKSSDTKVVRVEDGLLTAMGIGEATVTVTTEEGEKTETCEVTVATDPVWARSNIVWIEDADYPDGGYLTFAAVPEDNDRIPANVQGVFFRWGSLVALSPVGAYTDDKVIFSPTNKKTYPWFSSDGTSDIPFVGDTTGEFGDYVADADDFASYHGSTGFYAATGKGDICRYITAQGWVEGAWRMPTIAESMAETFLSTAEQTWKGGSITVPDEGRNAYGFYSFETGYFAGVGVFAGDNIAKPVKGVVFYPASGGRALSAGDPFETGTRGYAWSASSATPQLSSLMLVYEGGVFQPETARKYAHPVRCIREE